MPQAVLIVPCFDEASRLDPVGLDELARLTDARLLFVDDGSRDATRARLEAFCAERPARAALLVSERNRGKAESVRQGLRHALAEGAPVVGYVDADLATPPGEVARLLACLRDEGLDAVLAARIRFLGTRIERSQLRHYTGRLFATVASLLLRLPVYDTQCGAKVFRRTPALDAALAEPFRSRWIFDVELLGRLLIGAPGAPPLAPERIREIPLREWRHVPGSKLGPRDAVAVAVDTLRVGRDLAARRRARAPAAAGPAPGRDPDAREER